MKHQSGAYALVDLDTYIHTVINCSYMCILSAVCYAIRSQILLTTNSTGRAYYINFLLLELVASIGFLHNFLDLRYYPVV